MKSSSDIIADVTEIANDVFRPQAEAADRGEVNGILAHNVRLLASRGYYGLGISPQYGGFGADEATRREFTEIISSACGVTAFTQQQLHSGGGYASSSLSDDVKADLLPKLASGEILCGVAFSHLRRSGPPVVTAERVDGGFLVNGVAPWVTGWSLLDGFMLGASVAPKDPGGERTHLFAYVPRRGNEEMLVPSPSIDLHVMNASDTVEVTLRDLFVPTATVIRENPADDLRRGDYCGITGHVFLPLGCARGSVHYLRELAAKRGSDRIAEVAETFAREIDACRREALTWVGACADMPDYKKNALNARTWAIEVAVRAALAAVAATGGTAQMLGNAPQRLMREAAFYSTLAQTPDVQAGTLEKLTGVDAWTPPPAPPRNGEGR